jgi:hypothetical protein
LRKQHQPDFDETEFIYEVLTLRTAKEAARLFTAKPLTPADIAAAASTRAENFILDIDSFRCRQLICEKGCDLRLLRSQQITWI